MATNHKTNNRVASPFDVWGKPSHVPQETPVAALSKKEASLQKYNIDGATAHIAPELFRDLFLRPASIGTLKDEGVKAIEVSDIGIDMKLELFHSGVTDPLAWQTLPSVLTSDIVQSGIVQAAGLDKKSVIVSKFKTIGLLTVSKTNEAIAKIGANKTQDASQPAKWGGDNNTAIIFQDAATFESVAVYYKRRGGVSLTHRFQNASNQPELGAIGTLLHYDTAKEEQVSFSDLHKIQIQHLGHSIILSRAETVEKLTAQMFKAAATGYAIYPDSEFKGRPIAVLLPLKKELI